jgi:hypothetical protein
MFPLILFRDEREHYYYYYYYLLLAERYWVPRYLLVPGTAATLVYCTNPDDTW